MTVYNKKKWYKPGASFPGTELFGLTKKVSLFENVCLKVLLILMERLNIKLQILKSELNLNFPIGPKSTPFEVKSTSLEHN